MKLIIVTGMSGAGKSKAVDNLEDAGYYCLDNLPVKLLPSVMDWMQHNPEFPQKVAVTLDIRSRNISDSFFLTLELVRKAGIPVRVLFLECDDTVLIKRYKESRRLHPLMNLENRSDIRSALAEERRVLITVRESADYLIDTSVISTAELHEKISSILENEEHSDGLQLHFMSFGYKYGIPAEADLVFDVRCLPNPFYVEGLRNLTGLDEAVQEFVFGSEEGKGLFQKIKDYLEFTCPLYEKEGRARLVVAFGCTGGQHRSTAFTLKMLLCFREKKWKVYSTYRDMSINRKEVENR